MNATSALGPESPITSDNLHLSGPIPIRSEIAREGICNPVSIQHCTDPKVLELIAAATASNTHRAYQSDLAHFIAWGGTVPAAADTVAAYIAAHAKTLSPATLECLHRPKFAQAAFGHC